MLPFSLQAYQLSQDINGNIKLAADALQYLAGVLIRPQRQITQ